MGCQFSIIVPCYKVEQYLREGLNAVYNQTRSDWECLCVNDGSPDKLGSVLESYARMDKRFRVVHQPNRGVSVARNRALARVRGHWVLFLDGDDTLHPRLLQWVGESIEKGPSTLDAVLFRAQVGDERGAQFLKQDVPPAERVVALGEGGKPAAFRSMYGALWEIAYCRNLIKSLRFDVTLKYGEDLLFLIEAIVRMRTGIMQSWKPYGLRLRPGSAMRSALTKKHIEDGIAFGTLVGTTIAGTPLARDAPFVKQFYGNVVERLSERLYVFNDNVLWERWRITLGELLKAEIRFSLWQRLALHVCSGSFCRIGAFVFGRVAYALKRRINRQTVKGSARALYRNCSCIWRQERRGGSTPFEALDCAAAGLDLGKRCDAETPDKVPEESRAPRSM